MSQSTPTLENIFGVNILDESQLIQFGAIKDVTPVVSNVTGIKYVFPQYTSQDGSMVFNLLIKQNADGSFKKMYVRSSLGQGQQVSDADRIIQLDRNKSFLKFPPYEDENLMKVIPGLQKQFTQGKFILIPRWCSTGLYSIEVATTAKAQNITTILGDTLDMAGLYKSQQPVLYVRGIGSISRLAGLTDPDVQRKLTIYHIDRKDIARKIVKLTDQLVNLHSSLTASQGQQAANQDPKVIALAKEISTLEYQKNAINNKIDIPGKTFVESDALKPFVKEKVITPITGFNNNIIGRPSCIDLLSDFISPDIEKVSQPQFGQQLPTGFLPLSTTTFVQEEFVETVELPASIEQNVKNYMEKAEEGCVKGACNVPRVDTLIDKIQRKIKGLIPKNKLVGRFLNISTGQYKIPDTKVVIYVGDIIPGDFGPLQLSMTHTDMARLIDPNIVGKVPENQKPLVNAVFKRIERIIRDTMGTTTEKSEPLPSTLDIKTVSQIPTKKPSISKKEVAMVRPLKQIVRLPLEGVAGIVDVKSDTERCIPSLTVKKRDLK